MSLNLGATDARHRVGIERHYTPQEVAETLAVTPRTVRTWIDQGELKAVKLHRQWRIPASEIRRILDRSDRAR